MMCARYRFFGRSPVPTEPLVALHYHVSLLEAPMLSNVVRRLILIGAFLAMPLAVFAQEAALSGTLTD